jgi:hypothetical protein
MWRAGTNSANQQVDHSVKSSKDRLEPDRYTTLFFFWLSHPQKNSSEKADITPWNLDVRFAPKADIGVGYRSAAKLAGEKAQAGFLDRTANERTDSSS